MAAARSRASLARPAAASGGASASTAPSRASWLLAVGACGRRARDRHGLGVRSGASRRSTSTSSRRRQATFGETGRRDRARVRRQPRPRRPRRGDGAAGRRADRDLRQRVRATSGVARVDQADARRPQRPAVDRDRDLRLRAARRRARAERASSARWRSAIIMLPLSPGRPRRCSRSCPTQLREGSLALGVSKWRTILGVILPTTLSGILTGDDARDRPGRRRDGAAALHHVALRELGLGRSRATRSRSIPVTIFTYSEAPDPHLNDQAWAAAFVLIAFVLVTSLRLARAARAQPPQARARLVRLFTPFSPELHRPGAHARTRPGRHWRA